MWDALPSIQIVPGRIHHLLQHNSTTRHLAASHKFAQYHPRTPWIVASLALAPAPPAPTPPYPLTKLSPGHRTPPTVPRAHSTASGRGWDTPLQTLHPAPDVASARGRAREGDRPRTCLAAKLCVTARPEPPVRVRVEIMGSQNCRIVGKSQSVLMMINPIIFTRTRKYRIL
eukprot:COSAG01_NODE_2182_length_8212_cov_7.046838_2_plen_172_part_00